MGHRYLTAGCAIVNDMLYADGRRVKGFLGGTLYTLNGVKPYCDDVLYIAPAGPDFADYYGEYMRKNGLDMSGIECVLSRTQYTTVEYSETGQWHEYSVYGPEADLEAREKAGILPEYIVKHCSEQTRGIYFEADVDSAVWQGLDEIRRAAPYGKIMYEVASSDAYDPERRQRLFERLRQCDVYSINLPESKSLFETESEEASIERIIEFGKPCFFRVGVKGSYMIEDTKAWFAPSVGSETSVDPTGCGNCSTGAAMYGWCEGLHPLMTAIKANLASGLNAAQFGPYPLYTEEVKRTLIARADEMFSKLKGENG